MPKIISKENLPEFHGMNNVVKYNYDNGVVIYCSQPHSFESEVAYTKACKLNTDEDAWGHWLYLFNAENITVGKYAMSKGLWEFTAAQLVEQKMKLFFYKKFNPNSRTWESWVQGTPAKTNLCKEGCGLLTILQGGKWFVVDKDNKYIVEPGKYDYIDGFDSCGYARVKINGYVDFTNPEKTTHDKWGIIDTKGVEILPLEYSEIWNFYNKNREYTTVFWGTDGEGFWDNRAEEYQFLLKGHKAGSLRGPGFWFGKRFITYDESYTENIEYNYSMWDAFEDSEEAAAAAGFEW